jgi:hypothetical protein
MTGKITSYIAANEGKRAQALALAVAEDPRFLPLGINPEIPVDCQFSLTYLHETPIDRDYEGNLMHEPEMRTKIFNIELKEPADYIQSALGNAGHLYSQILSMREAGHPGMVVVLGDDADIGNAVKASLVTRYRAKELGYQIASYNDRLQDFEAQAYSLGIPVMRWKASPWRRLLSLAHKILTGASLLDYKPRPAEGEREIAAAAMCFKGIGPELMKTLLIDYQLCFAPRADYARPIEELPGWGKKRCEMLAPHMRMIYSNRVKA